MTVIELISQFCERLKVDCDFAHATVTFEAVGGPVVIESMEVIPSFNEVRLSDDKKND